MITYRQVLALLVEIIGDHGVTPPEPERLTATVSSILTAPDHSFLVAESHGHLVGMCALVFSLSTWSASPVCELQDLVVTRSHRRGHVGRGLVQTAESIAQARGCSRLFLMASTSSATCRPNYVRNGGISSLSSAAAEPFCPSRGVSREAPAPGVAAVPVVP
jgi:GNAT superfamily N-acetyltransferase